MKKDSLNSEFFGGFWEAVKFFRQEFPLNYPIKVTVAKVPDGYAGDCTLMKKPRHYRIRISNELPADAAVLVLIHEFAHALSWNSDKILPGDHNAVWGIAYGQVYRAWFES